MLVVVFQPGNRNTVANVRGQFRLVADDVRLSLRASKLEARERRSEIAIVAELTCAGYRQLLHFGSPQYMKRNRR